MEEKRLERQRDRGRSRRRENGGSISGRDEYRRRGKRKKKSAVSLLLPIVLLAAALFVFGGKYIEKYIPSKEPKDLNEWFEVKGDLVRLHLNDKRENDITAIARDEELYIPISWVKEKLNDRFFWNPDENLLVYTLPEQILHFNESSVTKEGKPVYIFNNDRMLLSYSTVAEYTDVTAELFIEGVEPAKRAFLYKDRGEYKRATVKKNAKLRTKAGIKAPVLTEVDKAERITVLEEMDKWDKVFVSSGFTGYIEKKKLSAYSIEKDMPVYSDPVPKYYDLGVKPVIGWHQVLNKKANAGFDEVVANTDGKMNVICPTWIQINSADGGYDNFSSREYVDKAHSMGLKVWPVIDNFNNPTGFKEFSTKEYFANSKNRQDFIERLMEDAIKYGYDGFNLDFESLPKEAGESYAQFYRELAVECRNAGLALSIDNYVPYNFNEHYNIKEQGYFADYIIIMGYDEHTYGSEKAGPVASLPYVKNGIEKTVAMVPHERVINAVPLYTRIWSEKDGKLSSKAMGMKKAAEYVAENQISLSFDEELGLNYGEKEIDGSLVRIWMEDAESLKLKTELSREYGLGGIAAWKLGFEPSEVWEILDLNK